MSAPVGTVLAREGGSYRLLLDGREYVAILRGKAKRAEDRAIAGDIVTIDPATLNEETLAITGVEPRRTLLARRVPDGRGTRPVAANVDQVVVVIAAADPDPIPQLMDRLLVVAEANEIPCWVVVNKTDLGSAAPIEAHLRASGYRVLPTAARAGEGVEELRAALFGRDVGAHRAQRRGEVVVAECAGARARPARRCGLREGRSRHPHHRHGHDDPDGRGRLRGRYAGLQ
ncbi:MAG: GTPase RsgA [Gemmatimonadetes bacterium]|nr:GTPase RsgA [Gemmatimonadota bacterium]